MPSNSTLVRAKRALCQAFESSRAKVDALAYSGRYPDYAESVQANIIQSVAFADCRKDFELGKGSELLSRNGQPPKMAAMFSSSALVVNSFGPWRNDPGSLVLKKYPSFKSLQFEGECQNGLRQFSPHATNPQLDVLLESSDKAIGVESKCLEYLSLKTPSFSATYDKISDDRTKSAWFKHIASLRKNPHVYHHLDVAQLIKHALGLSFTYMGKHREPPGILYIYWEPSNWQGFDEFKRHREEIEQFSMVVGGESLHFEALSYLELWEDWRGMASPSWLAQHVKNLSARYVVEI